MEKSNEQFAALWEYIERHEAQIEKSLREHLPVAPPKIETEFNETVEYALFSNGKNVRPVLTLLGAELFGGNVEEVLPSAAAVEYIHTSSQIIADLPSMHNADAGLGKTAVHRIFGEGLALLAALGLLNASYPLVFVHHIEMPERALQAHQEIAECVGASGLVGGQTLAKNYKKNIKREPSENLRTSGLIRLAMRIGAILAGADYHDLANLSRFAELFSDVYGLSVELNDSEKGSSQQKENKRTKLHNLAGEAKSILVGDFPSNEARSCLIQLTEFLAERKA
jgi:geranylgeranyl diphosphate synthase type II